MRARIITTIDKKKFRIQYKWLGLFWRTLPKEFDDQYIAFKYAVQRLDKVPKGWYIVDGEFELGKKVRNSHFIYRP